MHVHFLPPVTHSVCSPVNHAGINQQVSGSAHFAPQIATHLTCNRLNNIYFEILVTQVIRYVVKIQAYTRVEVLSLKTASSL